MHSMASWLQGMHMCCVGRLSLDAHLEVQPPEPYLSLLSQTKLCMSDCSCCTSPAVAPGTFLRLISSLSLTKLPGKIPITSHGPPCNPWVTAQAYALCFRTAPQFECLHCMSWSTGEARFLTHRTTQHKIHRAGSAVYYVMRCELQPKEHCPRHESCPHLALTSVTWMLLTML